MARGLPIVWSGLLASPFVYAGYELYSDAQRTGQYPPELGLSLIGFGLFIVLVGVYVQVVAPDAPRLREGERIVETRTPTQRVAMARFSLSLPFFGGTAYLYFFTLEPYIYPTVTLLFALYFFSSGLITYWGNTLTTYYVTDQRVISEYRFLSLSRKELAMAQIRAIEERQSLLETLGRVGNLRVAAGGGGRTLEIVIRNINEAADFADTIRTLVPGGAPLTSSTASSAGASGASSSTSSSSTSSSSTASDGGNASASGGDGAGKTRGSESTSATVAEGGSDRGDPDAEPRTTP